MSVSSPPNWPVAELDSVRRLRVMAAAMPGAVIVEAVISAPLPSVWTVVSDLERQAPRFAWHVRSLRITASDGDRIEAIVHGPIGVRDQFAGVLRSDWCWMQGRVLSIGMAAAERPDGTLLAFAAGVRLPCARLFSPLTRRELRKALDGVARLV